MSRLGLLQCLFLALNEKLGSNEFNDPNDPKFEMTHKYANTLSRAIAYEVEHKDLTEGEYHTISRKFPAIDLHYSDLKLYHEV